MQVQITAIHTGPFDDGQWNGQHGTIYYMGWTADVIVNGQAQSNVKLRIGTKTQGQSKHVALMVVGGTFPSKDPREHNGVTEYQVDGQALYDRGGGAPSGGGQGQPSGGQGGGGARVDNTIGIQVGHAINNAVQMAVAEYGNGGFDAMDDANIEKHARAIYALSQKLKAELSAKPPAQQAAEAPDLTPMVQAIINDEGMGEALGASQHSVADCVKVFKHSSIGMDRAKFVAYLKTTLSIGANEPEDDPDDDNLPF